LLGEVVPGIFGTEISAWTAVTPQGPWHYEGKSAATSIPGEPVLLRRAARTQTPRRCALVLYSVSNFDDLTKNVSLYGVKFESPTVVP
jgi:hypothetical protein